MTEHNERVDLNETLDPKDWTSIRMLGHRMMDEMMDYLENISAQPVWKSIPPDVKRYLGESLPQDPSNIESVYEEFKGYIFPYTKGNIHPRFFAWVEGGGTPFGVLAEFLATVMNPNVTIGEHSPMYVDMQVVNWSKQMLNYPETATGILLSGGSMANIVGLIVARDSQLQKNVRKEGVTIIPGRMLLYCSTETHSCVEKAAEIIGLGSNAVKKIRVNTDFTIDIKELVNTIEKDIADGNSPFCIVANAGTVNTAAIDPLDELLNICRKYKLWLHVDGAFGALAKLVPAYDKQLKGIEQADSVAFDFHKWMNVPYETGCVLIKDANAHRNSFSITPNYLLQFERGLSAGPDSINNFGPELSRGFKALKIWMSLKEHGIKKYASMINKNIMQAFYLERLVKQETDLELLTPVTLNIVCFRFIKEGLSMDELNNLNKEILMQLQEQGIASPSSTILNGQFAIRVCIVNHRSRQSDFDMLVKETLRIGRSLV